jgi:hypothetical protein
MFIFVFYFWMVENSIKGSFGFNYCFVIIIVRKNIWGSNEEYYHLWLYIQIQQNILNIENVYFSNFEKGEKLLKMRNPILYGVFVLYSSPENISCKNGSKSIVARKSLY